jgi:Zn-dependent protease with chaperone function
MYQPDADQMDKLNSIEPLNDLAIQASEKIGLPWFEAAVNGIRLSEDQLPDIFALAVRAARIIGLPSLPEIYVSGANLWDAVTLGSENRAFISLGTVLSNLRGEDLLFILGREMGHVAAGHALWRTVLEMARGRSAPSSLMGGGFMQVLNPMAVVKGAMEAPLMAWKRYSEITADQAGFLVVGKLEVAERVLTQWALKSFHLYQRLDLDAWRQQQNLSDDETVRLSEWAMTTTPYVARRLKLLHEYASAEELKEWRDYVADWRQRLPDFEPSTSQQDMVKNRPEATKNMVRLVCAACHQRMLVPRATLEGSTEVNIRCPNRACRKVMKVKAKRQPTPGPEILTQD